MDGQRLTRSLLSLEDSRHQRVGSDTGRSGPADLKVSQSHRGKVVHLIEELARHFTKVFAERIRSSTVWPHCFGVRRCLIAVVGGRRAVNYLVHPISLCGSQHMDGADEVLLNSELYHLGSRQ